ncbi:hypothetical protein [Aquimarina algiphila]|uniref:hypothetical protein n=1 Tax=Aquimarina algiphila TaxID=2047982 RepID=UPI00248FFAF4|nr:hypothetical protein [Aquimarina algiphila]
MFRKIYKVKGEDVNDFMVMQDIAYHRYASSILETFLFEIGYSKQKLNTLKIGLQKCQEELVHHKPLMFMQNFFLNLELLDSNNNEREISIRTRFFDTNNGLCAISFIKFNWYDHYNKKMIAPPKRMIKHLLA